MQIKFAFTLGLIVIFDFVLDTWPRQNANKICFYTRLNRIFVTDKFFPLPMKLFIKNMVCPRCILVVRDILRQAGIEASSVVLGEAVLPAELTAERRKELDEALRAVGFELIDDRRKQTVERVKNTVIELVREKDAALRTNLSDYIADRLHQDYGAVSSLFSEIENTTIDSAMTYTAVQVSMIEYYAASWADNSMSTVYKTLTYKGKGVWELLDYDNEISVNSSNDTRHRFNMTTAVEHLERVYFQNLLFQINRKERSDIVTRISEGHLSQVIRSE